MKKRIMAKLAPLFAASLAIVSCRTSENNDSADAEWDAGTDTNTDTDTDGSGDAGCDAGDTDTVPGIECECSSEKDNYCSPSDNAMQCLDGCHFTEQECWCADCTSCCTDGECVPSGCDGDEVCAGADENYCSDELILMECQVFPDYDDNYFLAVDCWDSIECDCGSGCTDEGIVATCWCCQTDGGVGDAGADGG